MTKTSDIPLWAKVGAILIVPILTAGVAWGVGQARLASLEARVAKVEESVRQNTEARITFREALKTITSTLHEVREDVKELLRGEGGGQ